MEVKMQITVNKIIGEVNNLLSIFQVMFFRPVSFMVVYIYIR